jgi:ketosteroid isomerase-like protein
MTQAPESHATFAHRLSAAANSHDIESVVACFTDDYLNETPVHPARDFRGSDQVRRNWTAIFAGVPDIVTTVLRADEVGDEVWSEWEMRGTRRDGVAHLMRGMMRFTVLGDQASAVRFYLEPVDAADLDADQSVQRLLSQASS